MKLLVGLGNPGKKYLQTRHNVGFNVADLVADRSGIEVSKKKFSSLFGIGKINGIDVCILKPQTFMNLSGEAVLLFARYYKVDSQDILVVHDDIDMQFARLKFTNNSGAGGHNGVTSIIDMLGSKEFYRLKVGIGRPPENFDPADYVLHGYSKEEKPLAEQLMNVSADAVECFIVHGATEAMQKFNNTLVSA